MDIYAIYALDVCVCEWNVSLKASRTPHQDDRLFLEQGLKFGTPPLQYMDVHGTMRCFGSSVVQNMSQHAGLWSWTHFQNVGLTCNRCTAWE